MRSRWFSDNARSIVDAGSSVGKQQPTAIRAARPDELEGLTALCVRSKAAWGYPRGFLETSRDLLTVTPERLVPERIRVAELGGRVVGVSSLSVRGCQAEIELLFVDPDMTRCGVGRALIEDLADGAREAGAQVLWILSDPGAEPFYAAQGALRVGERPSASIEGRRLPWMRLWLGGPAPELRTTRLRLRAWRDEDRAPFASLNADPDVARYLPTALTREASDKLAQRLSDDLDRQGFGLWSVERTDLPGAPFVGFIGLSVPRFEAPFTPCVEIGWRLHPEHWGEGLATEGAIEALRFGFEEVQLDEVVSFTTTANAASRRVMEKIGLIHDDRGDFEHPDLPAADPLRPHVLYRKRRLR